MAAFMLCKFNSIFLITEAESMYSQWGRVVTKQVSKWLITVNKRMVTEGKQEIVLSDVQDGLFLNNNDTFEYPLCFKEWMEWVSNRNCRKGHWIFYNYGKLADGSMHPMVALLRKKTLSRSRNHDAENTLTETEWEELSDWTNWDSIT